MIRVLDQFRKISFGQSTVKFSVIDRLKSLLTSLTLALSPIEMVFLSFGVLTWTDIMVIDFSWNANKWWISKKNVQLVCNTFWLILTSSPSSVAMAFGSLDSLDSSEADILVFKRKSTIKNSDLRCSRNKNYSGSRIQNCFTFVTITVLLWL